MEIEGYQPSTQSKFNYANAILQRIDYLQYKVIESYSIGDIEQWFHELKKIKFQVIGRMEDGEEKELESIESKICYFLSKKETNEKYKTITIKLIEKYLSKIQKKIENWGMGLVNQKDESMFT